ncbi:sigma-70 family RNA polymerase sigma factor [bacterium]|nr:sigma-70 family RNA polymerase sigma factor [candidate division CSSED10-310 bacterium]
MNVSDYELIERCLSGDKNAFRPLVEQYQRYVFDTVFRMVYNYETAKDLTQEVFMKAFAKLHTFNPKYTFGVWIHRIAIHSAIDFLRRRKPEYLILDNDSDPDALPMREQIADTSFSPYSKVASSEAFKRIQKAVYELEPKLKAVVILRHFREMNYDQISDVLKIPLGTVKNRLFRAREKLQEVLLQHQPSVGDTVS